ncbi:MAG: DNA recombination/repair protein RecA, partial [Myxococcales bacterium]|nr:DNA recombination/repair protein RecA [Myxococcales bacterium]
EIEGEMGDAQMGLQARLMAKALRKLNAAANQSGTTIIFINQLRQKIGVTFGSGETTTGGNSLKFYASVRIDIRRIGQLKDGKGVAFGNRTRVTIVKNKLAPPCRRCEFDIVFGKGVCQVGELLDLGVELGVVEKSGAWYSAGGERLGLGKEKAKEVLLGNKEALARLRGTVMEAAGALDMAAAPPELTEDTEDDGESEAEAA